MNKFIDYYESRVLLIVCVNIIICSLKQLTIVFQIKISPRDSCLDHKSKMTQH